MELKHIPIRRKICKVGNSLAVFLPKSWLELLEERHGQIEYVAISVNGKLTIEPILKEKQQSDEAYTTS